jgi:hypothetical protein
MPNCLRSLATPFGYIARSDAQVGYRPCLPVDENHAGGIDRTGFSSGGKACLQILPIAGV